MGCQSSKLSSAPESNTKSVMRQDDSNCRLGSSSTGAESLDKKSSTEVEVEGSVSVPSAADHDEVGHHLTGSSSTGWESVREKLSLLRESTEVEVEGGVLVASAARDEVDHMTEQSGTLMAREYLSAPFNLTKEELTHADESQGTDGRVMRDQAREQGTGNRKEQLHPWSSCYSLEQGTAAATRYATREEFEARWGKVIHSPQYMNLEDFKPESTSHIESTEKRGICGIQCQCNR
eukprot:gnl/MRDRNA2_/MRDRNA2_77461_c0_seq1.p1 gnl/MRDRNA2_/MRDRNA2_77461_c0~~gnl/MRDRNA2_/MRDRNA2_77461_c0_seq1.p1  ORF type:complete len:249 (-),score=38.17 gnl/MRDRNA2_/MRDRNA2_77461_c0_seq1:103-807(-)